MLENLYFVVLGDCYLVLIWLVSLLVVDFVWVVIGGVSVGGGFVVVLVLFVCDCGGIILVF